MAHHLLDLVALQVADEVQRRALIGVFRELLRHLLDPVFPQGVNTGGNGCPAGGGVIHLAGAHQGDLSGVPARLPGGLGNLRPDAGDVFRNGHGFPTSFF